MCRILNLVEIIKAAGIDYDGDTPPQTDALWSKLLAKQHHHARSPDTVADQLRGERLLKTLLNL